MRAEGIRPAKGMESLEQKKCSRCGDSFGCGLETGQEHCWCEHLPHVSLVANEDQDCLCPNCLPPAIETLKRTSYTADEGAHPAVEKDVGAPYSLLEGVDYYSEGTAIVFTARYLLRRGYCCENRCRHCPYGLAGP